METYEKLLRLGVFKINDVDAIYGNRNSAASSMRALLKKKLVTNIKRNLYVCNDIENKAPVADKYKIGTSIKSDAYISHHSALEFYGLGHQMFFEVFVSTVYEFKDFEFGGVVYRCTTSKIPEGVVTYATNRGIRVTDLERTVIDCIKDIDKAGGLEELLQCLKLVTFLDSEKLERYLGIYNIQFLYQKTGFIMEHFQKEFKLPESFFELCKSKIVKSKRYLEGKDGKDLVYSAKWRLLVPRNLMGFVDQGGSEFV